MTNNKKRIDGLYDHLEEEVSSSTMDLIKELVKLEKERTIKIHFSEEDLQELDAGETFDWNFDGVNVHLYKSDDEDEDE